MKFAAASAVLASLALSTVASAKPIVLSCTAPATMAGAPKISIEGELATKRAPNGQIELRGTLDVLVRTARKTIYDGKPLVRGVYDKVSGIEYVHVGNDGKKPVTVYVSYSNPTDSNLEIDGESYPIDCK